MAEIFRFDAFELDATSYQLRRDGRVVRLERIPLELLFLLVRRRGELVSRQEILGQGRLARRGQQYKHRDPENPAGPQGRSGQTAVPAHNTGEGLSLRCDFGRAGAGNRPCASTGIRDRAARKANAMDVGRGSGDRCGLAGTLLLVRPKPAPGKVMLAVLPFTNLSGDPAQEYLADGMTEEMITELGGLDPMHLGVIARTSAMQYKNAHKSGAQIASELSVKYLLEGSVRRSNGRVRVTAQLIQASDQTHLWAEDFDRDPSDILELQGEVARAISAQIHLALSSQTAARLAWPVHVSSEAHEAYLQGLYEFNQRSAKGSARAVESLERAIALDPNYAAAYSALARVYAFGGLF